MAKPITSRQRGFSLIELMVSLTLGLLVTLAITGVYQANRGHYSQSERFARMQEAGRFALDILSRDLSLAHFWGGRLDTEPPDPGSDVIPLTADCGPADVNGWAFDVRNAIEYFMPASLSDSPSTPFQCIQDSDGYAYSPGTNVLAVKHATGSCASMHKTKPGGNYVCPDDEDPSQYEKSQKGHVYLRTGSKKPKFVLSDDTTPATDVDWEYVVHLYYVAVDSASGIPSLRRKRLTHNAGIPAMEEDSGEVVEGVEFFHIQFGVADSNLDDNVCDQGNPGGPPLYQYLRLDKTSDTFHSPQHPLKCAVSARIYVLVRSLEPDALLPKDNKTYELGRLNAAGALTGNDTFGDHLQRRVYTTTVQLRNLIYQHD